MDKPKVFSEFTQHLLLYTKGHYGRTFDILEDLKNFMTKWSGTPKEGYDNHAIYRIVASSFVEACSKPDIIDHLVSLYDPWRHHLIGRCEMTIEEQIASMLGLMSTIPVKHRISDTVIETLVELPEPNPKYYVGKSEEPHG